MKTIYETALGFTVNTGSPHLVRFEKNIEDMDIALIGKKYRHSELFKPQGINVNFVSLEKRYLKIRTYERGVEAETLACGTGAVATALIYAYKMKKRSPVILKALGGKLKVYFRYGKDTFSGIWLEGPAEYVFETQINI